MPGDQEKRINDIHELKELAKAVHRKSIEINCASALQCFSEYVNERMSEKKKGKADSEIAEFANKLFFDSAVSELDVLEKDPKKISELESKLESDLKEYQQKVLFESVKVRIAYDLNSGNWSKQPYGNIWFNKEYGEYVILLPKRLFDCVEECLKNKKRRWWSRKAKESKNELRKLTAHELGHLLMKLLEYSDEDVKNETYADKFRDILLSFRPTYKNGLPPKNLLN